ncbi:MAG: sulfatase [Bacteroidales bacterium]|nr:sulfatase [Bacteroidales bacterium]
MKNFVLGGMGLIALTACNAQQSAPQLPNIIYVFPDQLRNAAMEYWSQDEFRPYVNFQGDPTHTPRLNEFARQSVVLSSCFSNNPVSSPHRGSLFTGMYSNKSGVPNNCQSFRPTCSLPDSATCVSDVLYEAGYDCAYIGKLHLFCPTPNDPQHPGQYVESRVPAWDAYTEPHQRHHFDFWYSYGTFDVHKNPHYWDSEGNRHDPHEYSPKHEADKAIEYMRNEGGKLRDSSKPFFMMISMNPPHSPYQSTKDCMEEDYNLYKDTPLDSLLVRPNVDFSMDKTKSAPYYFANVTGVDREFGRILDALKELGLDKNTIVIFTSDHGETMCSQGVKDPKNSPYAESVNVPFMIRYPDHLKPRVDNLMLSTPDIYPTLLGLVGLKHMIPGHLHGRDLSDIFFNPETTTVERPESALYFQNSDGRKGEDGLFYDFYPNARGLKTDRYTIAFYLDKKTGKLRESLFFDDVEDPYQQRNIPLDEKPEVVKELCQKLGQELKRIDDRWYQDKLLPELITY